jgi:hypothetical protein
MQACILINIHTYCNVLGVLRPFSSRVYLTHHFWTPICNVLGYWRYRSVCYTVYYDFTSRHYYFYNVLWPSDFASLSGPGSFALTLGSSLICVSGRSFDLSSVICSVSSFGDLSSVSLFSVFCFYSAAPEVGCWRPGKKTPCHRVSFPVLALLRF